VGGVTRVSKEGRIDNFSIKEDPTGVLIFNMRQDGEGNLWAMTNIGLFLFKDASFQKVVFEKTLEIETFFDLQIDQHRHGWLTSPEGIIRVNMEDLIDQINGKIPEVGTKVFNQYSGMANKECTAATPSLKTTSGQLWVPTFSGITVIDPQKETENLLKPPVFLTSFQVDQVEFDLNESVKIPPGSKRFSFDFTSLSFVAPSQVKFRYKLENFDPDWIETINIREANYTNLSPGEYTFMVKGSNNDHYWNEEAAIVNFLVQPFFYETFWFYLISGTGVLGIFAVFYFARVT